VTRKPSPRLLVVSSVTHGHRSFAAALAGALGRRGTDFDHVPVRRTLWNRVLGYAIQPARGADLEAVRRQVALDVQLRSLARTAMSDYDVVHVVPSGFAHAFARVAPNARAALSVGMDCTAELMRDEFASNRAQEALRHHADRLTFERATHVACLSDWARQSLLEHYRRDAELTDVVAVSAPVPAERARREPRALPRIGFVGAPWTRKGGDRLVDWFRSGRLGPAELHIVCRDAPATLRNVKGVVLYEPMPRSRVLEEFLPACDLFALPTRRDQSPWVVAEAAAAGLAVVASRIGGIHELVVHNVSGYLPDRDDDDAFCKYVARLVDDATLRDAMGDAAHAHAAAHLDERRNFDILAERLVGLATGRDPGVRQDR
jgi:glycosyltransferase involved in cell wall biosynthesis